MGVPGALTQQVNTALSTIEKKTGGGSNGGGSTLSAKATSKTDINQMSGWDYASLMFGLPGVLYNLGEQQGAGKPTKTTQTLAAQGAPSDVKDIINTSDILSPLNGGSAAGAGEPWYEGLTNKALLAAGMIGALWVVGKYLGRGK